MNSKKCQATTKAGNSCTKYASHGKEFCHLHDKKQSYFNEECPICLTNDGKMHVAACMHRMHLECAKGMNNLECPLCRKVIDNYPLKLKAQIIENGKVYKIKNEEEDLENLETLLQQELMSGSGNYPPPVVYVESVAALNCLMFSGIPTSQLPTSIDITIYRDSPDLPEGLAFYSILQCILAKITNNVNSIQEEDFSEEEFSSSDSDEDSVSELFEESQGDRVNINITII